MIRATPEMIAAAWAAWHSRHRGSIGPGPAFVEAINAALEKLEEQVMTEHQKKEGHPAPVTQMTGVKPLEWESYQDSPHSAPRWKASHPFGEYRIIHNLRDGEFWSPEMGGVGVCWNSRWDAQAAIQAHYEKCVTSALSPSPETNLEGPHIEIDDGVLIYRSGTLSITVCAEKVGVYDTATGKPAVNVPLNYDAVHAVIDVPRAAPSQEQAEPIEYRNGEAGFVEFLNEDRPYIVRDLPAPCAILTDMETRKVIGYRVYDPVSQPPQERAMGPMEGDNG